MYFDELERLLINFDWKVNKGHCTTGFRRDEYSTSVGYTCHWAKPGAPMLPSAPMKKDPSIFNECKRLFPDFDFECVIINKNLLCPPHKDTNNMGDSLIVGLGDYDYGEFVVEGTEHCILYSPLIFNGKHQLHWTEHWHNDRYTVILCNSKFKSYQ